MANSGDGNNDGRDPESPAPTAIPSPRKSARERSLGTLAGFKTTTFDLKQQLRAKSVLKSVTYSFHSKGAEATQWRVVRMEFEEHLSRPYRCVIELANEDLSASPRDLLGHEATLSIHREPMERLVNGIVHKVKQLGVRAGHLECSVEIVPAMHVLSLRKNYRIFQDMSTVDIVQDVYKSATDPYQRAVDTSGLSQARYHKREYTVQHGETDLEFIQRLMDEDGIVYFFDPHVEGEILKLVDKKESYSKITTLDFNDVEIASAEGDLAAAETVRFFRRMEQLQPTTFALNDYDWSSLHKSIRHQAVAQDKQGNEREWYEGDARLTIAEYSSDQKKYTYENGMYRVKDGAHSLQSHSVHCEGEGNVTNFAVGKTFRLSGHTDSEQDAKYVITAVKHLGEASEELTSDTHSGAEGRRPRYWNHFECVPFEPFWRAKPAVHRPKIASVLTATVVGPRVPGDDAQDDIYTDEHGRIKVQFHWDREGEHNERSSVWMRVMQPWGGAGWGFVFIPRVGMEVLIAFVDGDPDRPIVLGSAYNGTHAPPYALPENKTRSVLRTQSTPGGGGQAYNELRFEDAAGNEEVFLRAQKDLNELVLNSHDTQVLNSESLHVHVDRSMRVGQDFVRTIGRDQRQTIHRDRYDVTHGNHEIEVKQDRTLRVERNESTLVMGDAEQTYAKNRSQQVHGMERVERGESLHSVKTSHVLRVGETLSVVTGTEDTPGSSTHYTEGTSTVTATDTLRLVSNAEVLLQCGKSLLRIGPDSVEISSPTIRVLGEDSSVTLREGTVRTQAKEQVTSKAKQLLFRSSAASVALGENAKIDGTNVLLKSSDPLRDEVRDPAKTPTTIELKDQEGHPIPFQRFVVVSEDGRKLGGVLDKDGKASFEIEGEASVEFPDLAGVKTS